MLEIRLRDHDCLTNLEADALAGKLLENDSFSRLVEQDCDVFKPDGSVLLKFRKRCLPKELVHAAYGDLLDAAKPTDNRGIAAGPIESPEEVEILARRRKAKQVVKVSQDGAAGGVRYGFIRQDGTKSAQNLTKIVNSGLAGYFERSTRHPYCRQTAYTMAHQDRWQRCWPFFRAVDEVFQREMPERHAAQLAIVQRTHPDWTIHGTAFSTITVNRNWQTAVHKDAGDLAEGFGVLTAIRSGRWEGCYLCFPRFRVAVDMRTCDLLLCDVHEWHGNTPLSGQGKFTRLSMVFYYRSGLHLYGSAADELERAKQRKKGDPLS